MTDYPEFVTTSRLQLHRWDAERHAPALATINAVSADVRLFNDGVPYTPEQSTWQSQRFAAHWQTYGFGLWAVESSGWIVGFAGAIRPLWFPAYEHEVELGWRLHPAARGNGFATEAAREALRVAFAHLAVDRVISCIDPANAASIAVAERLGMTLDVTVNHPQRAGELHIYQRVNSR